MTETPKWAAPYEPRLILFLDILGFKDIVDGTVNDAKRLESLIRALDRIIEIGDNEGHATKRVSHFSDSIVVSFHITEESAAFWLLTDIAFAIVDLAAWGFLVRGAVTYGLLIHDDTHLLGPAMIEAYAMESKEAVYPRVIVDPDIMKVAHRFHASQNTPAQEAEYVKNYLHEDNDGRLFIDYISWEAIFDIVGDADNYGPYLANIGQITRERLVDSNIAVKQKGLWLHRHYLNALDALLAVDPNSDFYDENAEACDMARTMSRLEGEETSARAAIAATEQID